MLESHPAAFVIDADAAVRRRVAESLRGCPIRVDLFDSIAAFLQGYGRDACGCVVLHAAKPGTETAAAIEALRQAGVPFPVVVRSRAGDVATAVAAMRAGAFHFLEKPDRDEWRSAVLEATRHDAARRKSEAKRQAIRRRLCRLTDGERDVLWLLLRGESNAAIADRLDRSTRSIEERRAKLMRKMHARSLAELVRLTLLVDPSLAEADSADALPRSGSD